MYKTISLILLSLLLSSCYYPDHTHGISTMQCRQIHAQLHAGGHNHLRLNSGQRLQLLHQAKTYGCNEEDV